MDELVEKPLEFVSTTGEALLRHSGIVSLAVATITLSHDDEYMENRHQGLLKDSRIVSFAVAPIVQLDNE